MLMTTVLFWLVCWCLGVYWLVWLAYRAMTSDSGAMRAVKGMVARQCGGIAVRALAGLFRK
jgi:hypothetical protein